MLVMFTITFISLSVFKYLLRFLKLCAIIHTTLYIYTFQFSKIIFDFLKNIILFYKVIKGKKCCRKEKEVYVI